MSHQSVGYIRVSSVDQNADRQLTNIELDKKFIDKITGSIKERPALQDCIEYVREGDSLYIDSIDRLARNLLDLQDLIRIILAKNVTIKFMKENLVFSSLSDPMANLTLHIMGAFAEFERSMIRSRQREGIDAAKKAGKHLGRRTKITKSITKEISELKSGGTSIRQIAIKMSLSRATVYKALASV